MGKQCRPMYSIYIVDCTSVQRLMMFTDANTSTPLTSQPFTQAHTHTHTYNQCGRQTPILHQYLT